MPLLKCKMCGGDLNIQVGAKIAECLYCGSMQTIPNIDDERRASLYARAGQFRLNGDFDKAASIYDEILRDNNSDAEAHWSIVLCKYGIEYVQDPKIRRRIPTVNRMQYTSIFNDPDYRETLKYADSQQRQVYEYEAQTIDSIQNGILEISRKEKPFDIFISYKETDSLGRRTQDSVYAYDIYERLTQEGYRVFFSRVTLESVVGTAYEPYIFAALNSAKVMIVVGTSSENMNAVWVRNEWSRFLLLMQQDKSKSLIPVYKDMNPYELPAEFAYLQAQDMNRLGFIQDLVRGINKIIKGDKDTNKNVLSTQETTGNVASVESLLKRVNQFIDAGDWKIAEEYCNRILDIDPECAFAHFNLFCCKNKLKSRKEIVQSADKFERDENIKYAKRYANNDEKEFLLGLSKDCQNHLLRSKKRNRKKRWIACSIAMLCVLGCSLCTLLLVKKDYKEERETEEVEQTTELGLDEANFSVGDEIKMADRSWIVLAKEENKALLITKDIVCLMAYNNDKATNSWKESSVNKWLNNDFINSFNEEEKSRILSTVIRNDEHWLDQNSIEETESKIFLLSYQEANGKYLSGNDARKAQYNGKDYRWWLHTPGKSAFSYKSVMSIKTTGDVYKDGYWVDTEEIGVRPAVWISISGTDNKIVDAKDDEKLSKDVLTKNYQNNTLSIDDYKDNIEVVINNNNESGVSTHESLFTFKSGSNIYVHIKVNDERLKGTKFRAAITMPSRLDDGAANIKCDSVNKFYTYDTSVISSSESGIAHVSIYLAETGELIESIKIQIE